jgi:oligosaccharide repeat unit polymerase
MEKIIYTFCSIFVLFILLETSCYLFTYRYNIISIFSAWWLFNLNLVVWNPYNFYPISFERFILYHSPLVSFPLGYIIGIIILGKTKLKSKLPNVNLPVKVEQFFNRKVIFLILISNFIFSLFIFYTSMRIASSLGLDAQELRNSVFSETESLGGVFRYFIPLSWFSAGLGLYTTFYYLYCYLFSTQKDSNFNLVLSILTTIFHSLSAGGRQSILDLIFLFTSALIIVLPIYKANPNFYSTLKIKKVFNKFIYFLLILTLIIAIVSQFRSGSNDSGLLSFFYISIEYYVKYFTAPFFGFDQLIDTGRIETFIPNRFGYSFLGFDTVIVSGFFRFLNISSFLGLGEINSILSQISYSSQQGIFISSNYVTNAFYTIFLASYIDGGYLYAYALPLILGFTYSIINRKFVNNFNFINFSLILFSYYYLFNSVRYSLFQSPSIGIFLILISFDLSIRGRLKSRTVSRKAHTV